MLRLLDILGEGNNVARQGTALRRIEGGLDRWAAHNKDAGGGGREQVWGAQ